MNIDPVTDLLTRAEYLGARFRVSAGRVEVLGLHTLPEHVINDLRANSAEIRAYLVQPGDSYTWSEEGSVLLAWSAAAAELGLQTEVTATFMSSDTKPVSTTRVGLYATGYLARLARIRMRRRTQHSSLTREEKRIFESLAALKEAVDQVTRTPNQTDGTG